MSDLRTTNIFLRMVLFLFTLISVGAAVGLWFAVFVTRGSQQTIGIYLVIFAAICYFAAEATVSRGRLYRYGIEEALAVCSVGFLCVGMQAALFGNRLYSSTPEASQSTVPAVGAIFSLWIWHRFGLWYAFPAAMIFAVFIPGDWTPSHPAQHVIVALLYAVGLMCVAAVRSRHRFDYLEDVYSLAEALLWLGIYLAINLQLSSLSLRGPWWGYTRVGSEFARPFYWLTWLMTWCLPPVVLVRGIRRKDRFVIAAGAIAAVLTLVTNKPYLGWQRHTWDPILLGMALTGVALYLRRWLERGPGGIRHGFTAARLSGKDKHWVEAGSGALGLLSPHLIAPTPQPSSQGVDFGRGESGGGGASSEF